MNIFAEYPLACPLDGTRLSCIQNQLMCEQNHCFDISKHGHVNLLPVQHKKSTAPGDNKAMVMARRHFLETELYQPIAEALACTTGDAVGSKSTVYLLDAGCGEGYYLKNLQSHKEKYPQNTMHLMGFDISKEAIIACAKQNTDMVWAVATNGKLPILNNTLDIIWSVFGFPVLSEFARTLKEYGKLIVVEAGEEHLSQLRELIYPNVIFKPKSEKSHNESKYFKKVSEHNVHYTVDINNMQLMQLLMMTPHYYRAPKEGIERAKACTQLMLTISVTIQVYQKSESC